MVDNITSPDQEDNNKLIACSEKLSFESKEAAVAARAYAVWQHGNKTKLSTYLCRNCGSWHLASVLE